MLLTQASKGVKGPGDSILYDASRQPSWPRLIRRNILLTGSFSAIVCAVILFVELGVVFPSHNPLVSWLGTVSLIISLGWITVVILAASWSCQRSIRYPTIVREDGIEIFGRFWRFADVISAEIRLTEVLFHISPETGWKIDAIPRRLIPNFPHFVEVLALKTTVRWATWVSPLKS